MARVIELSEPQSDHWLLEAPYPLLIGGYGSGKTEAMLRRAIWDVLHLKADTAIYAPTFDLLRRAVVPRLDDELLYMPVQYTLNKTEWVFHLHGYGNILLRSIDRPERIVAYQTATAHCDELDTLTLDKAEDVWRRIVARTRVRPAGMRGKNPIRVYSTPEGYKFTYQRWGRSPDEGYVYVRARTRSNPTSGDQYEQTLLDLYPEAHARAFIEGIWTNLASGSVFFDFDRNENACTTVAAKHEALIVGLDFNPGKMAAVVYVRRDGWPHAVDEFVGLQDTPQVIDAIKERYDSHPVTVHPDATGQHSTSVSDVQLLGAAGFRVHVPSVNPLVRNRVLATNRLICNAKGERRFRVNVERCPNYTDALEQITWKGDILDKSTGLDHVIDAGTYPIERLYPVARPAAPARPRTAGTRIFA